ncbi:TlpA disulfide reductase family protein [Rhodoferax sp.]|uniref:TlpA family protein disulfide reductase n=1 Tax=Rhodoferax sp. TaxID=50421 RepID=UPI00285139D9|nr:TlpA disulfide reductase family protein [Rhodoferax sp.]MDR3371017.1 TlpA disulfide reductase family protein [Rhodoferax sp.]
MISSPVLAAEPVGLSAQGLQDYRQFLAATPHRAFAMAPGGAWGWSAEAESAEAAFDKALSACQGGTPQKCVPYQVDSHVVFDAKAWPLLWGPYVSAAAAGKAATGTLPGQRMFNLTYHDAQGHAARLSDLKGKVVVLHIWGSWCPPCRLEMPDLARLAKSLDDRKDVAFVLLQTREPFDKAQRWAESQKISLALSDSGTRGSGDTHLSLADGSMVSDRDIAHNFPSSYVLDKHGLVVFAQSGPVPDWPQYEAFIRDVVKRAAK